jgi:hypothetical protein
LVRGNNAIEVVAVDASGQRAVATVNVTAEGDDVPALRVEILSPEDGATVVGPDVTVSGAVAGEGIESVTVRLGERDAVDVTDTLSDAGAFVLSFESVDPGVWITLSVEAQAGDETASATISFMVEAPVEICENLIANASAERYEGEPIEEDGDTAVATRPSARRMVAAAADIDPNDPSTWGKVSRNAPCPCGSGKKYKQCHGRFA